MHARVAHSEDRQTDQAARGCLGLEPPALADDLEGTAQGTCRLVLPMAHDVLDLAAVEHRADRDVNSGGADAHLGGAPGLDLLSTAGERGLARESELGEYAVLRGTGHRSPARRTAVGVVAQVGEP